MLFKHKHLSGISLIEMMVVVAIIGIMAVVSLNLTSDMQRTRKLEAAAREIEAVLREAQTYALTGKIVSGKTPCLFNWRQTSSTDYSLYVQPPLATGGCDPGNEQLIGAYSVKNGVMLASAPSVSFRLPHAIPSPTVTRILLEHGSGLYMSVCVVADSNAQSRIFHTAASPTPTACT